MNIIPLIDLLGALFFVGAFIIALKNYQSTKDASNYWLIFAIAVFGGAVWAGSVTLEWMGITPIIIDDVQQSILAATIALFATAATVTAASLIQPTE